jgi:N-ethylmaleimide reductase
MEVHGANRRNAPKGPAAFPLNTLNDIADSDPVAYLHLIRGDCLGRQQGDVSGTARRSFHGVLVANMGYDAAEAEAAISAQCS